MSSLPGVTHLCRALLTALVMVACVEPTRAGDRSPVSTPNDAMHRSYMRIDARTPLPAVRRITIGVDKSMLIELPVDIASVLVSNPEVVNAVVKTQRQVYLLGKDQGDANAFFMGRDGVKLLLLEVSIKRDLTALTDALHRLLPGAKIRVEALGDNVVLTGSVMSPLDANRAAEIAAKAIKKKDGVLNMLVVAPPAKEQVLLQVNVVEMQRDAMRRLGVDLPQALLNAGNFTVRRVMTNTFPVTGITVPSSTAGSRTTVSWAADGNDLRAVLESLERTGLVRTLAKPTLTALSGESAKFLAGGEFPVPVANKDREIKIEFKSFGVSTTFRPLVLNEGRISLAIGSEVSELTSDGAIVTEGITVPALKVRRAETTLELPSGATLAMAGLLSDDTRQSVEGVPGLKSIPVLGQLFRSNDYRRRETELVILVTPYIATHMNPADAGRPDQGFAPASDLKTIVLGRLNRLYGPLPGPAALGRDVGFIIEYPESGQK